MMQRREILRRAAWLLGGAVSAPAALAVLQGCSAKEEPAAAAAARRSSSSAAELALVAEIAEIMIPKTDTSGAQDAGVPAFIDLALDGLYPAEDQARFKSGLRGIRRRPPRAAGKPFLEQDAAARGAFLQQSLDAALAGERDPKPFILMTRELTLLGLFHIEGGHHRKYGVRFRSRPRSTAACRCRR